MKDKVMRLMSKNLHQIRNLRYFKGVQSSEKFLISHRIWSIHSSSLINQSLNLTDSQLINNFNSNFEQPKQIITFQLSTFAAIFSVVNIRSHILQLHIQLLNCVISSNFNLQMQCRNISSGLQIGFQKSRFISKFLLFIGITFSFDF